MTGFADQSLCGIVYAKIPLIRDDIGTFALEQRNQILSHEGVDLRDDRTLAL
jgi:hypothetical protein